MTERYQLKTRYGSVSAEQRTSIFNLKLVADLSGGNESPPLTDIEIQPSSMKIDRDRENQVSLSLSVPAVDKIEDQVSDRLNGLLSLFFSYDTNIHAGLTKKLITVPLSGVEIFHGAQSRSIIVRGQGQDKPKASSSIDLNVYEDLTRELTVSSSSFSVVGRIEILGRIFSGDTLTVEGYSGAVETVSMLFNQTTNYCKVNFK